MKRLIAVLTVAALAAPVSAQQTLFLRQPTVSERHIAFAYANNIWVVDRAGGAARRLTSFPGGSSEPQLSPDGRLVAFTGSYAGNADVYVVPVDGGEPKRLTWHPGGDNAAGWTPDGRRVVFTSGRASHAPNGVPRFWTVSVDGGAEEALAIPRAFQGKISPDGGRIAFRMPSAWDEERRNYRGGQNKAIWVTDLKTWATDTIARPVNSKELDPVWIGDDVYFISDRDDVQNVWKYTRARQLTQVTRFRDFDVKTLGAGAGVLVFEQAGRIHQYDPASGRTTVVPITVRGDFPWMMPQWKDVTSRMTNLALSPTGKRALVEARGEVFSIPADKGDVRNLTHNSGTAERLPTWSPDGQSIAWFSDASGEYQLVVSSQDGITSRREIALPGMSFPYMAQWSPDSRKLSFVDTHLKLWVVDIAAGTARKFDGDPHMVPERSMNPVWSPDSRWIAFAKRLPTYYRVIVALDVESGRQVQLTDGMADATSPAWDASGKYLWFLASTNHALRSQWLDMTNYERPRTHALYVAVLKAGEPTPFTPESDDEPAAAQRTPAGERSGAPSAAPTVTIDVDGIARRIIAVPGVAEREYGQLKAGAPGQVFFTETVAATGTGGGGGGGGGSPLHRYSMRDRRAIPFATGVAQYTLSADGRRLLYRTGGAQGALFLVDAAGNAAPAANSGRLTATLRMWWDGKAEYAQIFEEARRKVRDYF